MPRFVHYLYLIPLSIGAIVSLRTFRPRWPRAYRYFSLFLCGTLVMELFAVSWKLWLHNAGSWNYTKSNSWIYNVYYLPEYLSYFLFYYMALTYDKNRMWIFITIGVVFLVIGFANLLFFQGLFQLDTYTIVCGNLGVLYCALAYFKQELQRKVPVRPVTDPLFWISTGAFIFHSVSLPYFIFINFLSRTNLSLAITLFNILLFLNIVMHTFYLTAFLCQNPYQKRSS